MEKPESRVATEVSQPGAAAWSDEQEARLAGRVRGAFGGVQLDEGVRASMLDALKLAAEQVQQEGIADDGAGNASAAKPATVGDTGDVVAAKSAATSLAPVKRTPRILRIALPAAACLVAAFIGVMLLNNSASRGMSSFEEPLGAAQRAESAVSEDSIGPMASDDNEMVGEWEASSSENAKGLLGIDEGRIDGNTFTLRLDATDGTGFTWMVAYQSDNLAAVGEAQWASQGVDDETGASADVTMAFEVDGTDDACLLLKYARPWEGKEGQADYRAYEITVGEDGIQRVTCAELYSWDTEFVGEFFDAGYFAANVPAGWEYEIYEAEGECGLLVRPQGESTYCRLVYAPQFAVCGTNLQTETLTLSGETYSLGLYGNDEAFSFLRGENGMCFVAFGATWPEERFLDVLELLDTARFEP